MQTHLASKLTLFLMGGLLFAGLNGCKKKSEPAAQPPAASAVADVTEKPLLPAKAVAQAPEHPPLYATPRALEDTDSPQVPEHVGRMDPTADDAPPPDQVEDLEDEADESGGDPVEERGEGAPGDFIDDAASDSAEDAVDDSADDGADDRAPDYADDSVDEPMDDAPEDSSDESPDDTDSDDEAPEPAGDEDE
jgi:hypothetical protein